MCLKLALVDELDLTDDEGQSENRANECVSGSVGFGEIAVFIDSLEQVTVDQHVRLQQAQGLVGVVRDVGDFACHALGERLVSDICIGERKADRSIRGVVERSHLVAGHRISTDHLFVNALGHILLISHGDSCTPMRRPTKPSGEPTEM